MDEFEQSENVKFKCPNCGITPQDKVIFICNTCEQEDLIWKEGIYICPACLKPGENFECIDCGSKEVKMKIRE